MQSACACVCEVVYPYNKWVYVNIEPARPSTGDGGVMFLRENELGHTRGVFALELAMYPGGYNLPFRQEMWL